MERLKKPPQRPSTPFTLTDAEAANQQLLAESASASVSKSAQPAAILGASLLNAARIHPSQASPPATAQSTRAGKLKRPSQAAQNQSRKPLARRGNQYDIFSLPNTVEPSQPSRKGHKHSSTAKNQPQVRIPVRRSTRRKVSNQAAAPSAEKGLHELHPNGCELQGETTVIDSVAHAESDQAEPTPIRDSIEDSPQFSETGQLDDIHLAFEFLNLEQRPGKCQTELGVAMTQTCKKLCELFQTENVSIVAISGGFEDLCRMLTRVRSHVPKEEYCAFKADAYGHAFRALLLYLKTLYCWFDHKRSNVTDSMEAMRLITTLTHEILAVKDTIASWTESVPQPYPGDGTFADVDSKLIPPLRRVSEKFRKKLSLLETEEQRRNNYIRLLEKRKTDVDNESRILQLVIARRKRWLRWQNLHILRMQCEPDPSRRRKLVITKLEHFEERDSNGVMFERLPIFKPRSTPPWHWVSTTLENRDWTDVEDIALLKGLQSFAGSHVWEKIFEAHCRPGGVLRDFNVASIVARATWARSAFMKLHQEKGWEIPVWVERIPTLP